MLIECQGDQICFVGAAEAKVVAEMIYLFDSAAELGAAESIAEMEAG